MIERVKEKVGNRPFRKEKLVGFVSGFGLGLGPCDQEKVVVVVEYFLSEPSPYVCDSRKVVNYTRLVLLQLR